MNAPSEYPIIDRYLDGLTTPDEATAVVEAVEADADALDWLRQSAEIEAALQFHFAGSTQQRRTPLRIVPFWHWRRVGKWCAAGAAAAALLVIAGTVLWPRSGTGGRKMALPELGMTVKHLAPGERKGVPLQQPVLAGDGSPMEEVEFRPGEKWLHELRNVQLDDGFDKEREEKGNPVTADEYLVRYLKAAGVTFPEGASAHWLPDAGTAKGLAQSAFVAINTEWNLARIEEISRDPIRCAPCLVVLPSKIWKFAPGDAIPPQFATDRILSEEERKMPRPKPAEVHPSGPQNWCGFQYSAIHNGRSEAEILVYCCRIGDYIRISGLSGTPSPGSTAMPWDFADVEFEMILTDRQEAVLHLGRKPDGADWILTIQPMMLPVLADKPVQKISLGVVPNVMKFDMPRMDTAKSDEPLYLQVKAGATVELRYKNHDCPLLHNFVLVKPGALDAVGKAADLMLAEDAAAAAKLYIPESPDIVATGSKLLKKGEVETICFMAPEEPGDYPYLCTFPGHWRLQQGILRVVK